MQAQFLCEKGNDQCYLSAKRGGGNKYNIYILKKKKGFCYMKMYERD